ncbi:hypothetical protein [Streptomyces sp. T028]|uniref:hypothetical protein n=1 Tax=Streptomyces sp. T028 TaxID=3394379 RepID=UPI003A88C1C3
MQQNLRWAAAGLVTIVVFVVCTWLCGAVLLPSVLPDPAIRWGVSSTAGVVLATFAVAWGQIFATRTRQEDPPALPSDGPVTASGPRSVAIKGNPTGNISTGDTGVRQSPEVAPARPEAAAPAGPVPAAPQPEPGPGSVTASGDRSIAINGNPAGTLSTGDQLGQDPA